MDQIFVGDSSDPDIAKWFEQKKFFDKQLDDEAAQLTKAVENLQKKRATHWNEVWDLLQVKGKISKDKKRDDFSMSVNIKAQQIFIEKQEESSVPKEVREFLKNIPGATIVEIKKKDDE